MALIAFELST